MGIRNEKSSENTILRIINGFDVIDYPSNGNERKNLYVLSTGAGLIYTFYPLEQVSAWPLVI